MEVSHTPALQTAHAAVESTTAAEQWAHLGSFTQHENPWFRYCCRWPYEIWATNGALQFCCELRKAPALTWLKYLQLLVQWRTLYVSPSVSNHCLPALFSWIITPLLLWCLKNTFSENILLWDFTQIKLLKCCVRISWKLWCFINCLQRM